MKKYIFAITVIALSLSLYSKQIVIMHTNDIKNVLGSRSATFINPDFPPVLGGLYSLSTAVKWEREKCEENGDIFLLFDSGNFAYKSVYGDSVDFSVPSVYFDYMKFDLVNLGLDEISAGGGFVKRGIEVFKTPLLLGNISFKNYDVIIDRYKIIERDGIKIGVFGITTEYALLNLTDEISSSIIIKKEIDAASEAVDFLKKSRCDIIIGLTSTGFEHDLILADSIKGIDLILSGNEGVGLRAPVESPKNHTVIIKGYGELSSFDKIVFDVDDVGNILSYKGYSITLFEEAYPHDLELKKILNK